MTDPLCPTCAVALSVHPAGECLNAWVAGLRGDVEFRLETGVVIYRRYSLCVEHAWLLVEALRWDGWIVRVQEMPDGLPMIGAGDGNGPDIEIQRRACCMLYSNYILEKKLGTGIRGGFTELGESSPLAIVRAYVRARSEEG